MRMKTRNKGFNDNVYVKIIFKNTVGARSYPSVNVVKKYFLSKKGNESIIEIQAKQGGFQ